MLITSGINVPFYAYHKWNQCPLLCLSTPDVAFYAYQSVEKTLNRVYSKQGLFSERSVRFEFSLPPKQAMFPFNFTSLKYEIKGSVKTFY